MQQPQIELRTVLEGPDYENMTEWFAPRAAYMPGDRAVMLVTRMTLTGSDVFLGNYSLTSDDGGRTWSEPVHVPTLVRRKTPEGILQAPADLVPMYHKATGKVLACGGVGNYADEDAKEPLENNEHPVPSSYTIYDDTQNTWSDWQKLGPLDSEHFYWAAGGAGQKEELPDGDILWPVYAMPREDVGDNFWNACFFTTVLRCSFDGQTVRVLEQGNEMTVSDVRGLCEPSLIQYDGRYLLTLRNDVRGYVTESTDGLHYSTPRPWTFDDGQELGSYNTQQHWLTVGGRLYLTYTRRGANNDHVFRHRAPVFLAEVDPGRLVVIRDSEQIVMPDKGGAFGNGGVTLVSDNEAWILESETMQGDAEDPYDLSRSRARGANNRVYQAIVRPG